MTRVLLADERRVVREALATVLDREPDIDVVAQADSAAGAVAAARRYGPEVALVGVRLSASDGIGAVHELRRVLPGCHSIVLGTSPSVGQARSALLAGALGFLDMRVPLVELLAAVRDAALGLRVGDPELLCAARRLGMSPLSRREREVLRKVATGADAADIARELSLSVGTVRNHQSSVMRKLAARTLVDALRVAEERDWLRGD